MELNDGLKIQYGASDDEMKKVWDGIIEYNKTTGPLLQYPPYERLSIIIKNESNNIVAGILSKIYLKSNFVEVFWIDESIRRMGLGSKLLSEIERISKDKGCSFIHLDTFSFQALGFYKKHGYSVFAAIEDYPDDIKRYYLKKFL